MTSSSLWPLQLQQEGVVKQHLRFWFLDDDSEVVQASWLLWALFSRKQGSCSWTTLCVSFPDLVWIHCTQRFLVNNPEMCVVCEAGVSTTVNWPSRPAVNRLCPLWALLKVIHKSLESQRWHCEIPERHKMGWLVCGWISYLDNPIEILFNLHLAEWAVWLFCRSSSAS